MKLKQASLLSGLPQVDASLFEAPAIAGQRFPATATHPPRILLQGARLPFDAPPHADVYPLLFPAPLQFNATQAEIRFDARYLDLPPAPAP